jgi:hypothetical protein
MELSASSRTTPSGMPSSTCSFCSKLSQTNRFAQPVRGVADAGEILGRQSLEGFDGVPDVGNITILKSQRHTAGRGLRVTDTEDFG